MKQAGFDKTEAGAAACCGETEAVPERIPHIALVTAYFSPEITPVTQLYADLAADFYGYGARVSVVTNLPNRGMSRAQREAYLGRRDETAPEGYRILRVGTRTCEGVRHLRRGLHSAINTLALYRAAKRVKADIYLLCSTPPLLGLAGARLSRHAKTVYLALDIFPDNIVATGRYTERHPVVQLSRMLERRVYKRNGAFITASEEMQRTLAARGAVSDRIAVIRNWADAEAVRPVLRADNPLFSEFGLSRDAFYAVYVGRLGILQDPDQLLDAAKLLRDQPGFRLLIFGDGELLTHVKTRIAQEKIDNALVFPPQPTGQLGEVFSLGDVALLPLKKGTTRFTSSPLAWAALAAGRPLVVCAEAGSEWARGIERERYGVCVSPGNARELADAILGLQASALPLSELGARARKYASGPAARGKATRACFDWLLAMQAQQ